MSPQGFLNPNQVLENWDIRPGDKIADFGCGPGFFSVPMGQMVGPNGKIYALDIRHEALEATRSKIKLFHAFNVEPTRADLEAPNGSGIRDISLDKLLIANILFQVEDQKPVISEAVRILRPGGSLLAVEWNDDSTIHPLPSAKVGKEELKSAFSGAGLIFQKEFKAGEHHYGLIFKKKE